MSSKIYLNQIKCEQMIPEAFGLWGGSCSNPLFRRKYSTNYILQHKVKNVNASSNNDILLYTFMRLNLSRISSYSLSLIKKLCYCNLLFS